VRARGNQHIFFFFLLSFIYLYPEAFFRSGDMNYYCKQDSCSQTKPKKYTLLTHLPPWLTLGFLSGCLLYVFVSNERTVSTIYSRKNNYILLHCMQISSLLNIHACVYFCISGYLVEMAMNTLSNIHPHIFLPSSFML